MDLPLSTLEAIRTVAERGSFTAAAAELGYSQSAVSRQVAAAERELGVALFERASRGVRLTRDGGICLRQIVVALDALAHAERMLATESRPARRVRLGAVRLAGSALLPRALSALRRLDPELEVRTREGSTPALVRAVRAGTVDAALVTSRAPFRAVDAEHPVLEQHVVAETTLALAVPSASRHAGPEPVTPESLEGEAWIASPASEHEPQLGVWPGLPGRPTVRHWARDWATKLELVAHGAGVTTVPVGFLPRLPSGVTITTVEGVPAEVRRVVLAHARELDPAVADALVRALAAAASALAAEG